MPINPQNALLGLSPMSALQPIGGDDDARRLEMQKQQLALQKQQFEETKRSNQEGERLQRMREEGDRARAAIVEQRAAKEAQAKVMADRAQWMEEFGKVANSGDMEALYTMAPQGQALGVGVELQDVQNGMPRFRLDPDPEATAKRQAQAQAQAGLAGDEMGAAGIGYKGTDLDAETAALTPAPQGQLYRTLESSDAGDVPTRESNSAALEERFKEAAAHYQAQRAPVEEPLDPSVRAAVGMPAEPAPASPPPEEPSPPLIPARGPDQPDLMGGVPSNVVDMPARHASLLNRLDPVMSSLANAYPSDGPIDRETGRSAQQGSADETKNAMLASGLSLPKALDAFAGLRSGPDTAFNTIRQADAQKERSQTEADRRTAERAEDAQRRAAERAEKLTAVSVSDQESFKGKGRESALKTVMGRKANEAVDRVATAKRVIEIMLDNDPTNDKAEGGYIARLGGQTGTITKQDVDEALGGNALSFWESMKKGFEEQAIGGLSKTQRQSIINRMRARLAQDRDLMFSVADDIEGVAGLPDTNKFHAQGMRDQLRLSLPADVRKEWEDRRKKTQKASAPPAASAAPAAATPAPGDDLGKAPLPKQLGEVETVFASWLGGDKDPAVKVLSEGFPGAGGGDLDDAVRKYISSIQADHPEAYAAAKRGDAEGFKRAMAGGGGKGPPKARSPEEQKILDELQRLRGR